MGIIILTSAAFCSSGDGIDKSSTESSANATGENVVMAATVANDLFKKAVLSHDVAPCWALREVCTGLVLDCVVKAEAAPVKRARHTKEADLMLVVAMVLIDRGLRR